MVSACLGESLNFGWYWWHVERVRGLDVEKPHDACVLNNERECPQIVHVRPANTAA